eukprot:m.94951 g.94951  ORF g.94951 m.94951 type:complete len:249 (-) comp8587_c0_seq1:309-1055(-)
MHLLGRSYGAGAMCSRWALRSPRPRSSHAIRATQHSMCSRMVFTRRITHINCFSAAQSDAFCDYTQPDALVHHAATIAPPPHAMVAVDSVSAFAVRHGMFWTTAVLKSLAAIQNIDRVVFCANADIVPSDIMAALAHLAAIRVRLPPAPGTVQLEYRKRSGKAFEAEETYTVRDLDVSAAPIAPAPVVRPSAKLAPDAALSFSARAGASDAAGRPYQHSAERQQRELAGVAVEVDPGDSDDPDGDLDI